MQPRTAPPEKIRRPAHLDSRLEKNLLNYTTAGTAAGVGLLALVQPAEAKIIYTPTNMPMTVNGPLVQLDVNNDGVVDFSFYNVASSGPARKRPGVRPPLGFYRHDIYAIPTQASNEVGAITSFNKTVCAAELAKGHLIGPNRNFQPGPLPMFTIAGDYTSPGTANCQWHGKANAGGYLALKFVSGGNTYYGWARVTLGTVPTLTGYAYENVPNQTIVAGVTHGADEKSDGSHAPILPAPQPASLGALAQGASALGSWRRSEESN